MITSFIGVLFDGVAYGSLLFLISIGLSVTLGLMNFINLAHGAFAMVGGYVCVIATIRYGLPFGVALIAAFAAAAIAGGILEHALYRRLYGRSPLDQVLFTIGLTFISIAAATLGGGLAGLGGALGIDVLGLDPTFPLKYMVYFLLVVVVGGAGTIVGTLCAAMVLGIFDVAGKYYVPWAGAFVIYALMVVLL